jgi:monoamine oxidase
MGAGMAKAGVAFDCDVVVIGAGAAGIAATLALHEAGLRVRCLEAAARIGGRVHTDTAIFGVPFDTGAHWLHTAHVNALKAPGLAMGLDLYAAPDNHVTHGLTDNAVLWDEVDALIETLRQAAQADEEVEARTGTPADRALADLQADNGPWSFTAAMTFALSIGRDLPDISVRDLATWEGGDDWFCRQGFGYLVARLAEGLPITLSTPVTGITVLPGGARVATGTGDILAQAVIVTVSVGVLAEDMIRFDPPLDADRRTALGLVTMGDYNHTALMFRPGAVPLQADTWLTYRLTPDAAGVAQGGGFLCNVSGTGLTCFETSGSFSRMLQAAGPAAAIEHGLDTLSGMFGSAIRRDFVKGHATAWRHNPFVRGSYAGALPGGHSQRKALRRTHADRVHFAGEASHVGQQCTVSGAFLEGQRAARDVARQLGHAAGQG